MKTDLVGPVATTTLAVTESKAMIHDGMHECMKSKFATIIAVLPTLVISTAWLGLAVHQAVHGDRTQWLLLWELNHKSGKVANGEKCPNEAIDRRWIYETGMKFRVTASLGPSLVTTKSRG